MLEELGRDLSFLPSLPPPAARTYLLEREEHASDGRPEGDGDAGRGGGAQDLPLLGLVLAVLGEEVCEDVAGAAGHVHHGALLAQAEAGRHRKHDAHALDQERPLAEVPGQRGGEGRSLIQVLRGKEGVLK